eukprot:TRINITY_DN13373_c0_g1_i1.p1 TRINITY_DN13373_c0_g1~~TRINITY_DN13373_c0_g1_i1.p1  ORF type:complete len:68 (-),score=2.16 TRINITY_DN13373_c0_g1_i1:89-292(-)
MDAYYLEPWHSHSGFGWYHPTNLHIDFRSESLDPIPINMLCFGTLWNAMERHTEVQSSSRSQVAWIR